MVLGKLLKGLFGGAGGGAPRDDRADYFHVRCSKCGEIVRVRVDRSNDLAQEFEDGGDHPTGYSATKGVVGNRCFRTMTLSVEYDRSKRVASTSVEGGAMATAEEFEAQQSIPTGSSPPA